MTTITDVNIASDIASKMVKYQLPGISMRLMHKNNVVYELDLGVGDVKSQKAIEKNSIFAIGCGTKPVVALALLILFEQQNLHVSDLVSDYLPSLKRNYPELQVGHLINHSGGLWRGNKTEIGQTDADTFKTIEEAEPLFPSGQGFKYSNWGYFLMGCIIEKVSGMSRTDYVSKVLFEPLGMANSTFRSDHKTLPDELIKGYWNTWYFGSADFSKEIEESPVFDLDAYAGGLLTTTDDYSKFLMEFLNPNSLIISPKIKELMLTPSMKASGSKFSSMGFFVEKESEKEMIYFPGSNSGFASFSVLFPESEVSAVIFANRSACNTELRKYVDIALESVFKEEQLKIIKTPFSAIQGVYYGKHNKQVTIQDKQNEYPELTINDTKVTLYHQTHRRFYMLNSPEKDSMLRVYYRRGKVKKIAIGAEFYYVKLPNALKLDTLFPSWKRFTGKFYCELFDKAEILQRNGELFINWGAIYETKLSHVEYGLFNQRRGPFHLEQMEFRVADNWEDDSFIISGLVFKRII